MNSSSRGKMILLVAGALAAVLAVIILMLGQVASDSFDPPDFKPTPAPSDWQSLNADIHPVPVEAVAIKTVPASLLRWPDQQIAASLLPAPDGGCLAMFQVYTDQGSGGNNPVSYLRVIHFKADGTVLWDRKYDDQPFMIHTMSFCVFPDGGFSAGLRTWAGQSPESAMTNWLLRFSPEGALSWQTEESGHPGALERIFAMPDGAVVSAGTVEVARDDGTTDLGVGLFRFEQDGRLSGKQLFASSEARLLMDASYSEDSGIVLAWRRSATQQAGTGETYAVISLIGCFRPEDLTEKWTTEMKRGDNIYEVLALPGQRGVMASGTSPADGSGSAAGTSLSTLFHLDCRGVKDWTYSATLAPGGTDRSGVWVTLAAPLADGRYVAGLHGQEASGEEMTTLLVFPPDGQSPRPAGKLPGIARQFIPTKDGGFTGVFQQSLRTIPQPPYVSSIWFDTEVIVAHYSSDLQTVWRRTIDRYKYSTRSDAIVATVDDRLLVD